MNHIKDCLCQAILIVVFTESLPAVALESPVPSPDQPYAGTRKNPLSYEVFPTSGCFSKGLYNDANYAEQYE